MCNALSKILGLDEQRDGKYPCSTDSTEDSWVIRNSLARTAETCMGQLLNFWGVLVFHSLISTRNTMRRLWYEAIVK